MLILYLKIQCGISQIWCYQIYLVIPTTHQFPDDANEFSLKNRDVPSDDSKHHVDGPVSAAITDFGSPIPLAAGFIDPSDAQLELAWYNCKDESVCILAIIIM